MTSMATRHWLASLAFELNPFWEQWVQRMRAAPKTFEARWEARARQTIALRQLRLLSDRELWDIGLSRCDIPRVAREATFVR